MNTLKERAERFALQTPLRYRVRGQLNWHHGSIENISRSGVLFRGHDLVRPDTPVEMRFVLPISLPDEPAAEVICSGLVVRIVEPSDTATGPAFAATISDYHLVRGRADVTHE